MPQRRFKPRERKSKVRDAKLVIIAAEGAETEKRYFEDLASDDRYRNSKVHVEVLETSSNSAPQHVIKLLDDFKRTYSLDKNDELWLVIDVDKWGARKLSEVSTQSSQKKYLLAVSNPCFEIWLLLHIKSLDQYNAVEIEELLKNEKLDNSRHSRTRLESELLTLLSRYDKNNLNTSDFLPHVERAIQEAKRTDINPSHAWPNQLGTRVYRLVESIIESSRR